MSAESYSFAPRNRTALNPPTAFVAADESRSSWQQELREAVRDPAELVKLLELPGDVLEIDTAATFPMLVPRAFIARMRKRDPEDPLLRQVLPLAAEQLSIPGFSGDPVREQQLARAGCIQKYPGRLLLVVTGSCPVHCRYCFRREFPYKDQTASRTNFAPALEAIRDSAGISEVILSGGDPLSLSNEKLSRLIARVERIASVRTLRLHTRFPIVLPSRVDQGLEATLAATRLDVVAVVHANHPAEIDAAVVQAAKRLKGCSKFLLNQSVLLKGVNDNAETLIGLSERLDSAGILPYYLHALDRVSGTAHFEIDKRTAAELVAAMRQRLPGYLVPKLVCERPGELSKTPIA
jgi:EF-P beta-lysylation protein EpmB